MPGWVSQQSINLLFKLLLLTRSLSRFGTNNHNQHPQPSTHKHLSVLLFVCHVKLILFWITQPCSMRLKWRRRIKLKRNNNNILSVPPDDPGQQAVCSMLYGEPRWAEPLCLSKYFQYLTFYPPVPPEHAICGTNITFGNGQVIPAADIPCHEIESFYTWHPLKGINLDILMLFIDGLLYFLFIGNQSTNRQKSDQW